MYTFFQNTGIVLRDSDSAQVAPVNDPNDAGYIAYQTWLDLGNIPTLALANIPQDPLLRIVTKLTFRRRFTLQERIAIDNSTDPVVRTLLTDLAMAEEINLDDTDLASGLAYVEQLGLIAPGRSSEILG